MQSPLDTTTTTDTPHPAYASHAPPIILTQPHPGVALATINRAAKLNVLSAPALRALGACFDQLSSDSDVRAVVLCGAGDRAFSAGLDFASTAAEFAAVTAHTADVARRARGIRTWVADIQTAVSAMEKCEKPVICVLHGITLGLAIDVAAATDIRICAADARFAVKEVDLGLAADIGTLARLPRIVGSASWVREVCLTARDFDAAEALAVGLVSRVCATKADALRAGLDMAAALADKSPVAVQGTKEILVHAQDHSVADNLRYAAIWNQAMLQSGDFQQSLVTGPTKRKRTYAKL